jgi:hypothetical protein
VWALLASAIALRGQCVAVGPRPELAGLYQAIGNLRLLDHTTPYFPGENLKVTITVTNTTSSPLKILDPAEAAFDRTRGAVDSCVWPFRDYRSVVIQPGQTVRRTIDSADRKAALRSFLEPAPCEPRTYNLTRQLTFEVGVAEVEAWAMVPVIERRTPQFALLVAAQVGGEHVLLVSSSNVRAYESVHATPGGDLSRGACQHVESWIRLLVLPVAVAGLKGTTDHSGRMTIECTEADGAAQTLKLDANRQLIVARK